MACQSLMPICFISSFLLHITDNAKGWYLICKRPYEGIKLYDKILSHVIWTKIEISNGTLTTSEGYNSVGFDYNILCLKNIQYNLFIVGLAIYL